MRMKLIASVLALSAVPSVARAADVYPGCAVPGSKAGHKTFYVDPQKGSLDGDGSAAKPWKTLADVLNPAKKLISTQGHNGVKFNNGTDTSLKPVNPNAPIKAGDVILLMSGDHGSAVITNMYNSDFITVAAAPGQTPVVSKLALVSSAKWVFQGIKFQGMATTAIGATSQQSSGGGLVTAGRGDWQGKSGDIVFANNSFSTTDDTSQWSGYDWLNKPYNMGLWTFAPCVSAVNNSFYNLLNGISVGWEKALIQGNTIKKISNDGIDLTASNLIIRRNTIKDGVKSLASGLHADAIQGWSNLDSNRKIIKNVNVLVDGNYIEKMGDPSSTYMQGISFFDGAWNNLTIQNNVVITNNSNGIMVFGATNSKVINNTVVSSFAAQSAWIRLAPQKGNVAHSSNVIVRNNIVQTLLVGDTGIVSDHNIVMKNISKMVSGKQVNSTTSDTQSKNEILPSMMSTFVTANSASGTYDLRPRPSSPALGAGSDNLAPSEDISAKSRSKSVTIGAYQ